MKMITTTITSIAFAFMMSCGGDKDVKNTAEQTPVKPKVEKTVDAHAGHDHAGHNHDHSAHADEATNGIVWVTDVNQALKLSKKLKKPVFTFFTGKQWCGWCKKLVAQVFVKEEFAKFVADYKPDEAEAMPAIKNYFKAYVTSDQLRHIIESKELTLLATNPVFSTRDLKAVPAKYRQLIPNYIKDYVTLNQFVA